MLALVLALALPREVRIEPLDVLLVSSRRAYVGPGGEVKVGQETYAAAGLTTSELSRQITLREGRQTTIAVIGTTRREIGITGDVVRSGSYPWREGLTLGNLLDLAQPREGSGSSVVLRVRGEPDRELTLATSRGVRIRPGDRLHFPLNPKAGRILVVGAVKRPGEVVISGPILLSDALKQVGGLRRDADAERILRTGKVITPGMQVEGGDVITVSALPAERLVEVKGGVINAGLYPAGTTLTAVLKLSGLSMAANRKRIAIVRLEGGKVKVLRFDLEQIGKRKQADPILKGRDVVEVEYVRV